MVELMMTMGAAIVAEAQTILDERHDNAFMLASMTMGETGLLFGLPGDAEQWVMWTARNRVESGAFPDRYWSVIEQGFHGHRLGYEPTGEMLALAWEVLIAPAGADPTGGCLYVMSGDDVAAHGWSTDGAVEVAEHGRWRLYFFREMPK